jgi:vancomycin resistance protein YoaR
MSLKKIPVILIGLALLILLPKPVFAQQDPLPQVLLKTDFNVWKANPDKANWLTTTPKLSWNGFDVSLPDSLDDALQTKTLSYLNATDAPGVDFDAVKIYLEKVVSPEVDRQPQDVTISQDDKGKIQFDGFAFNGQSVDFEMAYYLIRKALLDRIDEVRIPLQILPAKVTVLSDELKKKGITELISTGETNFARSPSNRRINIRVGLAAFNGKLIDPGVESGAGDILGKVDGSTGYVKELVIKGDKTIPDYGGGLCQVSTTVYRSLLMGGFPILERTNHSYAVSYYDPQGLDATIYPPHPDMRFKNDTPNSILLQTTTVGDKAYSNVYGTVVDRHVDLIGPWYYDYVPIPTPRTEYTTELAPGDKKKLGDAHVGFKADWFRRISYSDPAKKDIIERIHSDYEPRPLYTVIGIAPNTALPDGGSMANLPKNLFESP